MIADWLVQVDYWHWWILAGVMLLVEVMAPSFLFLWLALAAAVVGFVMLLVPDLGWQYQVILFSGPSVISIALFRRYQRDNPARSEQPALNRRGEQYIGRTFTLQSPIVNRVGNLRVDDTTWRITGDDLQAGTQVVITGVDRVVLQVKRQSIDE
jgi:membrane protein implicated in regulation of membrane protease activity